MTKIKLPKPDNKRGFSVEVNEDLLTEVKQELHDHNKGITMRSVIEYGMQRWLEHSREDNKSRKKPK